MKGKKKPAERFMTTVKVGPKGQIVIPKEVRDMFGISPGDSMLLFADKKRGIGLGQTTVFNKIADAIFGGHAAEVYPDQPEENSRVFAQEIRKTIEADDETSPFPEKGGSDDDCNPDQ